MAVDPVRAFLAVHAPDIDIVELEASTATVEMTARAHGVAAAQIARTLSIKIKDRALLIVTSGDARLNNRKIKDALGGTPRMPGVEDRREGAVDYARRSRGAGVTRQGSPHQG